VFRAATAWFLALLAGIGCGYLAWGDQHRRAETDLLSDFQAIVRQLEQHEKVLADLVEQREAKATTALAECERASEHVAKQLESCLFAKADARGSNGAEPAKPRALSGTAPVEESIGYPAPIAPKPPQR
jgi:uncharacterized protein HemX